MIITCIGHAKFLLELENGMRIVTDPYDKTCGYPVTPMQADVVLVSHGHHDHNAVETIKGKPLVIDQEGEYNLDNGVNISAMWADHDEDGGSKRGKTLIFRIQAEGLTVAHLGDLGHLLSEEQAAPLRGCDVLLIPVGGTYTVDGDTAAQIVHCLQPRAVIPMHYRSETFGFDNIDTVDTFLKHFPAETVQRVGEDFLDLTADTPAQVAVLTYRA